MENVELTLGVSIKHIEYTNHLIFKKIKYPNKTYTLILKFKIYQYMALASFLLLKESLNEIYFYFIIFTQNCMEAAASNSGHS